MREFELRRRAYDRKTEYDRIMNLEAWRQARFIAYNAVKPHLSNKMLTIHDFMPLEGDHDSVASQEQAAEDVLKYYEERGWIKKAIA